MKGKTKMELLNLFKRKKIKSGVCFSNQKSVEELKKIFWKLMQIELILLL